MIEGGHEEDPIDGGAAEASDNCSRLAEVQVCGLRLLRDMCADIRTALARSSV